MDRETAARVDSAIEGALPQWARSFVTIPGMPRFWRRLAIRACGVNFHVDRAAGAYVVTRKGLPYAFIQLPKTQ